MMNAKEQGRGDGHSFASLETLCASMHYLVVLYYGLPRVLVEEVDQAAHSLEGH